MEIKPFPADDLLGDPAVPAEAVVIASPSRHPALRRAAASETASNHLPWLPSHLALPPGAIASFPFFLRLFHFHLATFLLPGGLFSLNCQRVMLKH